ncbi:siderophore iron transporter mirb [Fusarium oxysporum f. sp. phaseoli]
MGATSISDGGHRVPMVSIERNSEKNHDRPDVNDHAFVQAGVRQVEAITAVWSTRMLWTVFVLLYFINIIDAVLQHVQSSLTPYVTSTFAQHGLLATTGVVSSIVGGVCQLTIAKVIDIWGRGQGYAVMLVLCVVGLIVKATCDSVEMYAAAHTLYWVGHIGIGYIITVVLADMTTLQNRTIMFGINTTPSIVSTFAGPKIAELFLQKVNFRWAFGGFSIILTAFSLPILAVFFLHQRKAISLGVIEKEAVKRSAWGSTVYYFWQFDTVGLFLVTAGWSLLLLPFSIARSAPQGWTAGYIIAMIVLGVLILIASIYWERSFARIPFFPWRFLKERTVWASCLLNGLMFMSVFVWEAYYTSYLQVVHSQSVRDAGYISGTFNVFSSFVGPFVGLMIRYTNDYKWTSMAGVPFAALGSALLVHFRRPDTNIGFLVMCQVFTGVAIGIWGLTAQLALMASVRHQEVAIALAMSGLFGSIGVSLGFTVAGALWTNIVPANLYEALPEDSKNLTSILFGDIREQLSYPIGSPVRDAVIMAFQDAQHKMVIVGACLVPFMLACIFVWKKIDLRKRQQEEGQSKGNIF